jgi:predicted MFS family arabinose efflux permease
MHNLYDSRQSRPDVARLERLLKVLSAATFLIFFQAYMVAPLIPRLSAVFGISPQQIGLIVPAYLIPYGVSTPAESLDPPT